MNSRLAVRLYVFHSFLSRLYFFIPIIVLWFQHHGFSNLQITLLLSTFFLSTTLAEVPTGIFSDRHGHKKAMILCNLLQAVGVFLLAYPETLLMAIAGEVLMGIGQAFYTGSKEAYLFNTLEADQVSERYQREYGQSKLFEFVGMGVASLIGGSVYSFSGKLPFFLTAAAFLLAASIGLLLTEKTIQKSQVPSNWNYLTGGLRELIHGTRNFKLLIAYYVSLFAAILLFIVILIQPYLKMSGVPLASFGLIFLLFQSASMGGSLTARSMGPRHVTKIFFFLLALNLALTLVGLTLFHHPLSFLLAGVVYAVWGIFLPTTSDAINRQIPSSERRATILATQDFLQHLLFVLIAPFLGWIMDHGGLSSALWLLSGWVLLTAFLPLLMKKEGEAS